MNEQQQPDPQQAGDINRRRFEKFVGVFEQAARAGDKSAEITAALHAAIAHPDNGLIAALDDLLEEIQGLRQDIRDLARVGGIKIDFGSIFRRR
jgi:hypothetical protein